MQDVHVKTFGSRVFSTQYTNWRMSHVTSPQLTLTPERGLRSDGRLVSLQRARILPGEPCFR